MGRIIKKYTIKQEQLEKLRESSLKDDKGLSHFVLIQNRGIYGEFVFRVVCECIKKPLNFKKKERQIRKC